MNNQKKALTVIRIIMAGAALFLIYNIIGLFNTRSSMEKYTSVIAGVVTDVEKKSDPSHGYYYKAYVTSEYAPGMKFESPSIKHKYTQGENVKIYCNPDDMTDYYIEGAEPISDYVSMIVTLMTLLIVLGIMHARQRAKLRSYQSGSV